MKTTSKSLAQILVVLFAVNCISFLATAQSDILKVRITGTNNYSDETVVRFLPDATNGFDFAYDAWKLFSNSWEVPSLYTEIPSGDEIAINSLPTLERDIKVELFTWVNIDNNYTFDFIEFAQFGQNIDIYLYDKETGTVYDVLNTASATIYLDANVDSSARFELHFSLPTTIATVDESCYGTTDGEILIRDPGNINWNYVIEDVNSNVVATGSNVNDSVLITGLAAGQYTVTYNTYYGITGSAVIDINAPAPIIASIAADQTTVYISGGATVNFQNTTTGATGYVWDFGDNNTSTDFEPIHSYATEGTYTVTMTASNGNCAESQTLSIIVIDDVTGIKTIAEHSTPRILRDHFGYYLSIEGNIGTNTHIELYSLAGHRVYSKLQVLSNQITYIDLNGFIHGIYIAMITVGEDITTQKILVSK